MTPELHDYLDALRYAKPLLGSAVSELVTQVDLEYGNYLSIRIATFEVVPQAFKPSRLKITLNVPRLLPRIERIEMNLCIISYAYWQLVMGRMGQKEPARHRLCRGLGCDPSLHNDVAERWRRLDFAGDSLPYVELEDRPECIACKTIIATGTGSTGKGMPPAHTGCIKYLKHVLVPAIREVRRG